MILSVSNGIEINMKVIPNLKSSREAQYVWMLARNLLTAKRGLRLYKKLNAPIETIEFQKGTENEAHNNYYNAKSWFYESIKKD